MAICKNYLRWKSTIGCLVYLATPTCYKRDTITIYTVHCVAAKSFLSEIVTHCLTSWKCQTWFSPWERWARRWGSTQAPSCCPPGRSHLVGRCKNIDCLFSFVPSENITVARNLPTIIPKTSTAKVWASLRFKSGKSNVNMCYRRRGKVRPGNDWLLESVLLLLGPLLPLPPPLLLGDRGQHSCSLLSSHHRDPEEIDWISSSRGKVTLSLATWRGTEDHKLFHTFHNCQHRSSLPQSESV